jgi:hypothetical protein
LRSLIGNFEEIQQKSLINTSEDPRSPLSEMQLEDMYSIHFDTESTSIGSTVLSAYEDKLHHDLKIRGMEFSETLLDCQH